MKQMPKKTSSLSKGAMRVKKLDRAARSAALDGEAIRSWFVADALSDWGSGAPPDRLLRSEQSLITATASEVMVIPLDDGGSPPKHLAGKVRRIPVDVASVSVKTTNSTLSIGGEVVTIHEGYDYEALVFASSCGAELPDWYQP